METWYKLDLGDGMQAFAPTGKIQDAWVALALAAAKAGRTDYSSAVFDRSEGDDIPHTIAYFTPAARVVAEAFGATPCEKPDARGIGLSVGDTRAWEIHFPGESDKRTEDRI